VLVLSAAVAIAGLLVIVAVIGLVILLDPVP
jgi:hypothetical protein